MKLINSLIFKLVILLVVLIVLLAAVDNSQEVALRFLDYTTFELPLLGWVIIAFVLGVIFTSLVNMWANTKLKINVRSANNKVEQVRATLDDVRAEKSLPLP